MPDLPIILAGPIVRRVDLDRVAVWVALSHPAKVRLVLFKDRHESTGSGVAGNQPIVAEGTTHTIRCGERLHIALVETGAKLGEPRSDDPPHGPLTPGTVYSYDIVVETTDPPLGPKGLLGLGLLEDDKEPNATSRRIEGVSLAAPAHLALGYDPRKLPSFVTPVEDIEGIRLAHASCRKIHGPGADAMAYLDDALKSVLDQPKKRIQQLFLTGDQIYADDVPTSGLPMIHDLAMKLMTREGAPAKDGEEEVTPHSTDGQPPKPKVRVNMATAPPLCRGAIIRTDAGFTSTGTANHLITFGEFAALYLLHWSPRVWEAPANDARVFEFADIENPQTPPSGLNRTLIRPMVTPKGSGTVLADAALRKAIEDKFRNDLQVERQRILTFANSVGKIARLLANTATYMIFDDHDVTDDWNINQVFLDRVYTRAMGREVVRNALLAYSLFQGIGNDWRSFSRSADAAANEGRANLDFLDSAVPYLATPRDRPDTHARKLDQMFGYLEPGAKRMDFHYSAPGKLYEVRVLDSRTRRDFPKGGLGLLPARLAGDSLEQQLPTEARSETRFLLLVSSTPVLGPELFERIGLPVLIHKHDMKRMRSDLEAQPDAPANSASPSDYAKQRTRGAIERDQETWGSNLQGQHELLRRLIGHHRVVILGGDVHFGTNLMMDVWRRKGGTPSSETARFAQLTSSASRNDFDKGLEAKLGGIMWLNQLIAGPVVSGLGWLGQGKVEPQSSIHLNRAMKLEEIPAILPADGWPQDAVLADPLPDWWFELSGLADQRRTQDRGDRMKAEGKAIDDIVAAETNGIAPGLELARAAARAHARCLDDDLTPFRMIVLCTNVGTIRFEDSGDKKVPKTRDVAVIHTLLSRADKGLEEDVPKEGLLDDRPLGINASQSGGQPNTEVRIDLVPPEPREAALNAGTA